MRQNHVLLLTTTISTMSLLWLLLHPQCYYISSYDSVKGDNLQAGTGDQNRIAAKAPVEVGVEDVVLDTGRVEALDSTKRAFVEEQERRAQVVREACARDVSRATYKSVLSYVIVDQAQDILFCPVYKSASSSWLIALLEMRGIWQPSFTADDLNRIRKDIYKTVKNYPISNQEIVFPTRFLVVRHPFERLLSCYRDKFENANKPYYFKAYGKKMMLLFRKVDKSLTKTEITNLLAKAEKDPERERTLDNPFANPVGPTFSEFVRYVVSSNSDDEHWRPYHQHCAPCSLNYNFILKEEPLS